MRKDKDHFLPMKRITHKEDVRTLNIYALNTKASDLIKQKHLDVKSQINPITIVVNDLDTPLTIDRLS